MEFNLQELMQKMDEAKSSQEIRDLIEQIPMDYFTTIMEQKAELIEESNSFIPTGND